MQKSYVYVGGGAGVPGLPHQITEAEALELGVADLLADAVANGNYQLLTPNGETENKIVVDGGSNG